MRHAVARIAGRRCVSVRFRCPRSRADSETPGSHPPGECLDATLNLALKSLHPDALGALARKMNASPIIHRSPAASEVLPLGQILVRCYGSTSDPSDQPAYRLYVGRLLYGT
jgi:hypothetical protein